MHSKSTILSALLLFLLSVVLPLNSMAQRNPTGKEKDRIENRFPKKEEKRPERNDSGDPQKHKQKEIPKVKNPLPVDNHGLPVCPPKHYHPEPQGCFVPPVKIIVDEIFIEPPYQPESEILNPNYKFDGIQKYKEGEYHEAIQDLNIAIEEDSNDFELYYYRGLTELKVHLYEEAENDLSKYLEYFFYEPDGYFQRGLAKFYLNEKEKAKKDFDIAAEMGHKQAISVLKRFY